MTTLCSLMLGMGMVSCSDSDDLEQPDPAPDNTPYRYGHFILNQGLWGANNANITLSAFTVHDNALTEQMNYYEKANGKKLGDLANAMMEEDDNIYVVLNGSKYVARLDK